jgi:RimJ/RimL family protein N-acetyltransferase
MLLLACAFFKLLYFFMKPEERIANNTDLDFIYSCILYGARKGHYAFNAENPEVVKSMKREIQSVISQRTLLDQRDAQATVFTLGDKRIATLILSEAAPDNDSLEIYAFSVAKKYQGKGYGRQILEAVLDRLLYTDVYARCSSASEKMVKLLESRSFRIDSMDQDYRVLIRNAVEKVALVAPVYMSV